MSTIANEYGIDSVAGAVIFAILYGPLLLFFCQQAIFRPTYAYIAIAFFCAIRVAAFVLRAFLAGVPSDGQNTNLLITFEIIYNIGFFGLLYSAYNLVLDRGRLSDLPLPDDPISRLTRKPQIFRVALVVAVVVGITGAVQSATGSTHSTVNTGNTLRKVSVFIFFILCIIVAVQTIGLVRGMTRCGMYQVANGDFGATHGIHILCVISLLLLTREAFFIATFNDLAKQNDENWWYPFAVLTEFVAVVMFATPGLVPSRNELPS